MADSQAQKEINELKAQLSALKEQMEQTAAATSGTLQTAAKNAGRKVGASLADGQERLGEAKNSCEDNIRQNPFGAVAAAFVGGAVLALLLNRR